MLIRLLSLVVSYKLFHLFLSNTNGIIFSIHTVIKYIMKYIRAAI